MSQVSTESHSATNAITKKRKLKAEENETSLEIDLEAPEPVSKKVKRKAKKLQTHDVRTTVPTRKGPDHVNPPEGQSLIEHPHKKSTASAKRSQGGIWIGNLPFFVTEEGLREYISKNLEKISESKPSITRVHLPHSAPKHGQRQNKGFAYVDFESSKTVDDALKLSETLLGGRRILIKAANDFRGRPSHDADANDKIAPSKRLFVGNLPFEITTDALQQHFQQCGEVLKIHMATFEDSGKCKGYAWVDFKDIMSAENARRGYIDIYRSRDEASKKTFSTNDEIQGDVKPRKRRIWVNRLGDRKMRLEFAEDPTTRYKKRFRNESHDEQGDAKEEAEGEDSRPVNSIEPTASMLPQQNDSVDESKGNKSKPQLGNSGYSQQSVEKLRGTIVHSQGTKVKFE